MGIKHTFNRYIHAIYWNYIVPLMWLLFNNSRLFRYSKSSVNTDFTIGIVTYSARYDKYFKELIQKISAIFPKVEIIVMINGYYDQKVQEAYLKRITSQLQSLKNVKYFIQEQPTGLSKLWNTIILRSKSRNIFILNDDIKISPKFAEVLNDMVKNRLCLINNSWSHFLITKDVVAKNGWFDERLTGVGNEDQDYEFRLIAKGMPIQTIYTRELKNEVELTTDFSYGKEIKVVNRKYSGVNFEFFSKKWNLYDREVPGTLYSPKFDMWFGKTPNLETPNFYPEITI